MGLMKQEDWAPARWIAMESVSPKDVVYPGFQLAGNKDVYKRQAILSLWYTYRDCRDV